MKIETDRNTMWSAWNAESDADEGRITGQGATEREAIDDLVRALLECEYAHGYEACERELAPNWPSLERLKEQLETRGIASGQPCCGQYETCLRPCTPRGEQLAYLKRDAHAAEIAASARRGGTEWVSYVPKPELDQMRTYAERLKDALEQYGDHDMMCDANIPTAGKHCNCGFNAALALEAADEDRNNGGSARGEFPPTPGNEASDPRGGTLASRQRVDSPTNLTAVGENVAPRSVTAQLEPPPVKIVYTELTGHLTHCNAHPGSPLGEGICICKRQRSSADQLALCPTCGGPVESIGNPCHSCAKDFVRDSHQLTQEK